MSDELKCDLCGSTDDVQMVEDRFGWGRSVRFSHVSRPRCASCRKKTHPTWRWADKSKRSKPRRPRYA
jgi:hypothetical protein